MEKTQEELLKMESELIDSQLKEAQLSQQHTENAEKLAQVQEELEHLSVENNKLITTLEEANVKVSVSFPFAATYWYTVTAIKYLEAITENHKS